MIATAAATMQPPKSAHISWHAGQLTHDDREQSLLQKGCTLWFTGLSASGKSTIACALEKRLVQEYKVHAYRLDGDNIRHGLNKNLGFSADDRSENIRRIAEVSKLFADSCSIALTSFISPYRADRALARALHAEAGLPFIEIFIDVPLEVVMERDPKGLYKKALKGEIKGFTGIDDPYEAPTQPEIRICSHENDLETCVQLIVDHLVQQGLLPS